MVGAVLSRTGFAGRVETTTDFARWQPRCHLASGRFERVSGCMAQCGFLRAPVATGRARTSHVPPETGADRLGAGDAAVVDGREDLQRQLPGLLDQVVAEAMVRPLVDEPEADGLVDAPGGD